MKTNKNRINRAILSMLLSMTLIISTLPAGLVYAEDEVVSYEGTNISAEISDDLISNGGTEEDLDEENSSETESLSNESNDALDNVGVPAEMPNQVQESDEETIQIQDVGVAEYNGDEYASLKEAVEAAASAGSGTVTLLKDTTDSFKVSGNMDIVIDLNGNTYTAEDGKIGMYFGSGAKALIKNGTITGGRDEDGCAIYAYGCEISLDTLTVTGNTSKFTSESAVLLGGTKGNTTITNCDFVENTMGALDVSASAGATIEIKDCNFKNNSPSASTAIISKSMNGNVTYENCEISGNSSGYFLVYALGPVEYKNCKIQNNEGGGVHMDRNAVATFENTDIINNTSPKESIFYSSGITAGDEATVTMTGGSLYGNTYDNGSKKSDIHASGVAHINVDSSVSKGDGDVWYEEIYGDTYDELALNTTSERIIYSAKEENLDYPIVIGDKKYLSLEKANADATSGDTIQILPNEDGTARTLNVGSYLLIPEGVTIDLNGNNVNSNKYFYIAYDDISIINSSDSMSDLSAYIYLYNPESDLTIGNNVNTTNWMYFYEGTLTLEGTHKSMKFVLQNGEQYISAAEDFTATNLSITYRDNTVEPYNDIEEETDDLLLIKGKSKMDPSNVTVTDLANSLTEITTNDDGDIVVHKNGAVKAIYIDGNNGDDSNDGMSEGTPVKSFEKAKEILQELQKTDSSYNSIYVLGTITVDEDKTLDLGDENNMLVRHPSFTENLINVTKGASLTLQDMTLHGNSAMVKTTESLVKVDNGTLTIEDGTVFTMNDVSGASYPAWKGGAISVKEKGTLVMNGGEINNCVANNGGAIFVQGKVTINDGLFRKNQAVLGVFNGKSDYGCGGAIASTDDGAIIINGGEFLNNRAAWDGGAISVGIRRLSTNDEPTLLMRGGLIDGNTAGNCGGGIFVQCNSVASISAGKLTNNSANGAYAIYTGGGIYTNGANAASKRDGFKNGKTNLTNVLITNNTASRAGSGLASCPTSNLELFVQDGSAIIDNDGTELYISNTQAGSHYGNPHLFLSSRMLGGSLYNWSIVSGPSSANIEDIVDQDYTVRGDFNFDNSPSGDYMTQVEKYATVEISGNYGRVYGGGVGSNGDVYIGKFEVIDISGTKTWDDDEDLYGKRPESITINLYADGTLIESKKVTAEDDWKYTFRNLPKTIDDKEVEYTISEQTVKYYEPTYDGFDIQNTYVPVKISIPVKKVWDDGNYADQVRPTEITVKLLADGEDTGKSLVLTEDNQWEGEFDDLDEELNGEVIEYTVEEVQVEGYKTDIAGDMNEGFVITNSYTPTDDSEEPEKVSVPVRKVWKDSDDADGVRPDEITVKLLADGKDTGERLILSEDNDWKGEFEDLDEKVDGKVDGKNIEYTVEEVKVKGYTTTISGDAKDGFIITNTHNPSGGDNPDTGDGFHLKLWSILFGAAIIAIAIISSRRKKMNL